MLKKTENNSKTMSFKKSNNTFDKFTRFINQFENIEQGTTNLEFNVTSLFKDAMETKLCISENQNILVDELKKMDNKINELNFKITYENRNVQEKIKEELRKSDLDYETIKYKNRPMPISFYREKKDGGKFRKS